MDRNDISRIDSTLLAAITQMKARGHGYAAVAPFAERLTLRSSRSLVAGMFSPDELGVAANHPSPHWADSLMSGCPARRPMRDGYDGF